MREPFSTAGGGAPTTPRGAPPPPPRKGHACVVQGSDSHYYYEHRVSGATCAEHPLLPVFREVAGAERLKRDRPRPWSSVEHWMIFAGDNDAVYFFNFATRQRSRELPGEILAEHERMRGLGGRGKPKGHGSAPPPPSNRDLAMARKAVALGRRPKLAEEPSEPSKVRQPIQTSSAAQRTIAKQRGAELVAVTRLWRHASLQLKPRCLSEVLVAASRLSIGPLPPPTLRYHLSPAPHPASPPCTRDSSPMSTVLGSGCEHSVARL